MSPGEAEGRADDRAPKTATTTNQSATDYRDPTPWGELAPANYTASELRALRRLRRAFPASRVGEFVPNGQQALWNGDGP